MSSSRRGARTMLGVGAALSTLVALALAGGPGRLGTGGRRSRRPARPRRHAAQAGPAAPRQRRARRRRRRERLVGVPARRRVGGPDAPRGQLRPPLLRRQVRLRPRRRRHGTGTTGARLDPLPEARTFELHSLPGSKRTIYLDFNGHIVTGTGWNGLTGTDPQVYGAYDTDGNPNVFGAAEKVQIEQTWRRVAEDFAPFNVDVTTQEPAPGKIDRDSQSDLVYGTRLLVTPGGDVYTDYCMSNCGGVAFVDVFDTRRLRPQLLPAGLRLHRRRGHGREEHRRGRLARGRSQPLAQPRRHLRRELLLRPRVVGADHGRRLQPSRSASGARASTPTRTTPRTTSP